ncbi:hypothetical protein [Provencibacterium massiliense]|uniref:hypothetical protein n=1 Tax=Provencibacterium massiliense TaxID=1841868 RepID=UPI0009A7CE33|nr:hypothetical protein [Provencibacterium massiliense]RGB68303.1 hypothetical protein DW086_04990 [Harryflintia acetispora]
MKLRISALLLAAAVLLPVVPADAAGTGITVTVREGYQCDYGVDIPFTPSPRTDSYTFALYEGNSTSGSPEVSAEVTVPSAGTVHLPLRYDVSGPSTWTLSVTAHVRPGREAFDQESTATKVFTTAPVCGCPAGTEGAFYAGDGSERSPYRVGTPWQLQHLNHTRHLAAGQHFRQTADLDFSSFGNWTPIGNATAAFTGNYDGDGYVISNLSCVQNGLDLEGLFGLVGPAKIERMGIVDSQFIENKSTGTQLCMGAFIGQSSDTTSLDQCYIKNCTISAPYASTLVRVGGLVGQSLGAISDCYVVDSSVTGSGREDDSFHVIGGGLLGTSWTHLTTAPRTSRSYTLSTAVSRFSTSTMGVFCGATLVGSVDSSCFFTPTAGLNLGTGWSGSEEGLFSATQLMSEAEFGNQSNFTAKGWDFSSVWRMDAALGYPVLRAFDH